jgi:hypothetical protein
MLKEVVACGTLQKRQMTSDVFLLLNCSISCKAPSSGSLSSLDRAQIAIYIHAELLPKSRIYIRQRCHGFVTGRKELKVPGIILISHYALKSVSFPDAEFQTGPKLAENQSPTNFCLWRQDPRFGFKYLKHLPESEWQVFTANFRNERT